MKTYKFRLYPTKTQEKEMNTHLWMSKNLWNELLAMNSKMYEDFGYFLSKNTMQKIVKKYGLFSQTQQAVCFRLYNSFMRYFKLKKQGKKCGFPRFKKINRMRSLSYPQNNFGFKLKNKLKINPFGELKIIKHRAIKGKIKTLIIKKEPSGKWFASFSAEEEKTKPKINNGNYIGIDLGLTTFATLSNGIKIKKPKHFLERQEKLTTKQREFSKKKKFSKNWKKANLKVARVYEKVKNSRADFLHKLSTKLVNNYSMVALEKLNIKSMVETNYGKQINDASWNLFANMLNYKAENAGCNVVFVNPRNTTKMCSNCKNIKEMDISERTYNCPECNTEIDRDFNASINILTLALAKDTAGNVGINACGDETLVSSMNQEAITSTQCVRL